MIENNKERKGKRCLLSLKNIHFEKYFLLSFLLLENVSTVDSCALYQQSRSFLISLLHPINRASSLVPLTDDRNALLVHDAAGQQMKIEFGAICHHSMSSVISALQRTDQRGQRWGKKINERNQRMRNSRIQMKTHVSILYKIYTYIYICVAQRSCLYTELACLFLLIKTCVINK